jgi:hypothetical protein
MLSLVAPFQPLLQIPLRYSDHDTTVSFQILFNFVIHLSSYHRCRMIWHCRKVNHGQLIPRHSPSVSGMRYKEGCLYLCTPWRYMGDWRYCSTHALTSIRHGGYRSPFVYDCSTPGARASFTPLIRRVRRWTGLKLSYTTLLPPTGIKP